jgi:hypothetical protein
LYLLVLKIVLSLLLIVCGFYRIQRIKEIWVWTFPVWGLLDLSTLVLDEYVFSSNLELFLIYYLILTIPLAYLYYKFGKISINALLPLGLVPIVIIASFIFDLIPTNHSLYSDYGLLNVKEYKLSVAVVCLIHVVYVFHIIFNCIKIHFFELYKLIILFGLAIYFVGYSLFHIIEYYYLDNVEGFVNLGVYYITIQVIISKGLIIIGLLWKE